MDSRALEDVWNRSGYAGFFGDRMKKDSFDRFVFSKLYFNPEHLIVAVERPSDFQDPSGLTDGKPIGFVHGGFRPNQEGTGPDLAAGFIAMLVVEDRKDQDEIRTRLLLEIEKVFARLGIRRVYAGAVYPNAPFYCGLLYGCELNGILENDPFLPKILLKNHYISIERHHILRFALSSRIPMAFAQSILARSVDFFTPDESAGHRSPPLSGPTMPADRPVPAAGQPGFAPSQPAAPFANPSAAVTCPEPFAGLQKSVPDFVEPDWWELCSHVQMQWNRFFLIQKGTRTPIAWVGARILNRAEDVTQMGLHHLYVKEEFRKQGYAKLLLTLVLNQLQANYKKLTIDLQVPEENTFALQTFLRMKFEIASTGNVFRRDLPEEFLSEMKTVR